MRDSFAAKSLQESWPGSRAASLRFPAHTWVASLESFVRECLTNKSSSLHLWSFQAAKVSLQNVALFRMSVALWDAKQSLRKYPIQKNEFSVQFFLNGFLQNEVWHAARAVVCLAKRKFVFCDSCFWPTCWSVILKVWFTGFFKTFNLF